MTCREKAKIEKPKHVGDKYIGGCAGCPCDHTYINMPRPDDCFVANNRFDLSKEERIEICTRCWDREIPGTEDSKHDMNEYCEECARIGSEQLTIKDSGARREFESGAVRDIQEGKGRCDLLPLDVVARLSGDKVLSIIDTFKSDGDYQHLLYLLDEAQYVLIYHNVWDMLLEVSIHFEDGAKKYGEYNWQKGIPVHCYIDSAVRHYLKYLRGDDDEYHDRAFVWNILCCIWTCIHKPELNEYKNPETTETNN